MIAVLAAASLAVFFYREPLGGALQSWRAGSPCTLLEAFRARSNERRQVEIKDRLVRDSRIVENDPKGYHLWETTRGRYWIPAASDFALHWDLAEQERKIYGTGSGSVRPGDIVLDCGANIGVYTREALLAGARLVVAIEPAPENLECLRRNFAPEIAAGRVLVYPKGVWDKEDFLTLHVDPVNSAANSFVIQREGSVGLQKMPLTTIDRLVAELKLERVDFIKMDVEGAEPRAVAGARETIARFRPRMALSVYHSPTDRDTVPAAVRAARTDYRQECGPCAATPAGVWPTVFYYR